MGVVQAQAVRIRHKPPPVRQPLRRPHARERVGRGRLKGGEVEVRVGTERCGVGEVREGDRKGAVSVGRAAEREWTRRILTRGTRVAGHQGRRPRKCGCSGMHRFVRARGIIHRRIKISSSICGSGSEALMNHGGWMIGTRISISTTTTRISSSRVEVLRQAIPLFVGKKKFFFQKKK
jgi:hypothetical protein